MAHEIIEQLGAAPDVIALPFGGGGNVNAVALGLEEAGGPAALVIGQAADRPTTWASAIRIAEPAHAAEVERLVAAGRVEVVTLDEDDLRHWWHRLSTEEGVFCEPASAAGVAALAEARCRQRPHGGRDHHRSRSEGHRRRRPVVVGHGRTRRSRRSSRSSDDDPRARAGVHREPRPRLRRRGGCARSLERGDRRGVLDGALRRDRRRRRRRAAARREPSLTACVRAVRAGRAPPFRFTNRIPFERGLGSSAAAIAIGLVAGAEASGRDLSRVELLAAGEELDGHADNLAAALLGGVCVTWRQNGERRVAQIATDLPLTPVVAVPAERTNTAHSRNGLPATVSHDDAVVNAAHAALLGAAVAAGDAGLLGAAFSDRLHEQYRLDDAPLLRTLRDGRPRTRPG